MSDPKKNIQSAVLFIDGECPVCNKFAEYVIRHDTANHFYFARLSAITENKKSILLVDGGKLYDRSTAILKTLTKLKGAGKLTYAGFIAPKFFRDFLYTKFAKNRLRFFKESETCSLDLRARLIEKEDLNEETLQLGIAYT